MTFPLYADPFTTEDESDVSSLNCGEEPWARAATQWITGPDVHASIAKHGTKVWIYRDENDSVVGFSSLGETGRRWPPPDGDRARLLMIPQLGIDQSFHGQPPDREWRYSNQLMNHLIYEARDWAMQRNENKAPKKHVKQLILLVHKDNKAAQRLYEKFDFVLVPDYERNEHFAMSHQLNLSD